MAKPILTQARLKELLYYDPETGVFTWKLRRGGTAKAGTVAGTPDSHGHIQIKLDSRLYLAHRLAFLYETGAAPAEVDHINQVKHDNRMCNLRPTTRSLNRHNCPPSKANKSGHRGVFWIERLNKWQAYISLGGKRTILGCFSAYDDAVSARRVAESEMLDYA